MLRIEGDSGTGAMEHGDCNLGIEDSIKNLVEGGGLGLQSKNRELMERVKGKVLY